ncbi:acetyl-CoA hydrolase/transferase family protein [Paraburkholderia aromaticivorans]|uniref:4-hydroxybutyrate CoA-transferase n=1 Tax=Paraburkholderia aromaticivorans TaxID=2026199 RepID=A0A248VYP5_9BURK|nr:acetyl-CoA hydrolase/transferase C-terminal domain-containing protein [Paraburkholderia aromaticivorans]ASW04159.1 4-hydroxybutyrate CoA-transferase [Paraburkholderia aromaticivorans]
MKPNQLLREKIRSAAEVAALVESGWSVDYGFAINQPDLFDAALAARRDELKEIRIRTALSVQPRRVVETDPDQRCFSVENWHFSGYDRRAHDKGVTSYIPFNFGEGPGIYRRYLEVDLAVIKTTPMDRHGFFNFGASNTYIRAACDVAKRIVVETSTALPHCYGVENVLHISELDAVIEGDNSPLAELPSAPVSDIDRRVAQFIVPHIAHGACLQIGIGGMPNAVCMALADAPIKDLGIHTEMFVDGLVALIEAGKITGWRKNTYRGKVVYTFALGTRKTYDFIDGNEMCLSLPVDETNLTENISRNRNVVSINNAMQIDLLGQVASESSGYKHRSGTGGQLQFVRGAGMSEGGKSFMCLSSRYLKGGEPASRIVAGLNQGTVVTTPRTDVMYVVTEFGIVNLKGKSVPDRAKALISIAHPDDRDMLEKHARDCGLLPGRVF